MFRLLSRAIALLLVASLISDPALASARAGGLRSAPRMDIFICQSVNAPLSARFESDGITRQSTLHIDYLLSELKANRRGFIVAGAIGATLGFSRLNAQSLVPALIQDLDSGDENVRANARKTLLSLSLSQDYKRVGSKIVKVDYPEVINALDTAFQSDVQSVKAGGESVHRLVGVIKVMTRTFAARAQAMVNELFSKYGRVPTQIFEAAVFLIHSAEIAAPTPGQMEAAGVQRDTLAAFGAGYLVVPGTPNAPPTFPSFDDLTSTQPHGRDFYLMIHYFALAGTLQKQFGLFTQAAYAKVLSRILDNAEIGPELTMSAEFKAGPDILKPSETGLRFLFESAHELGHNWAYSVNSVLDQYLSLKDPAQIGQMKAIDEFIGDLVGLAGLESLRVLEKNEVQAFMKADTDGTQTLDQAGRYALIAALDQPNPASGRWGHALENLRRVLPRITAATTLDQVMAAVLEDKPLAQTLLPSHGGAAWAAVLLYDLGSPIHFLAERNAAPTRRSFGKWSAGLAAALGVIGGGGGGWYW